MSSICEEMLRWTGRAGLKQDQHKFVRDPWHMYLSFIVDVASAPREASWKVEWLLPYHLVGTFDRPTAFRAL